MIVLLTERNLSPFSAACAAHTDQPLQITPANFRILLKCNNGLFLNSKFI